MHKSTSKPGKRRSNELGGTETKAPAKKRGKPDTSGVAYKYKLFSSETGQLLAIYDKKKEISIINSIDTIVLDIEEKVTLSENCYIMVKDSFNEWNIYQRINGKSFLAPADCVTISDPVLNSEFKKISKNHYLKHD